MQSITIYYLVYGVIDLILAFVIFRYWRSHVLAWKMHKNVLHIFLMLVATLLLLFATAVTLLLLFITFDSWQTSLDPTVPKPMFEMIWIFGFLAAGITGGFARGLHALVQRDYKYFLG